MLLKTDRFTSLRGIWSRAKGYGPLFFYTLLLLKGALMSPGEIPDFISRINDKFLHAVEYFFLFLFSAHTFWHAGNLWLRERYKGAAMVYALVLGVATEAAQFFFTTDRAAEIGDLFLDGSGALAALFFLRVLKSARLKDYVRQEVGAVI